MPTSLAGRRVHCFVVKRRLALVIPALVLSGCSLATPPAPQPDLVALADSALNDASSTSLDPSIAAARKSQAERLYAEVRRLCGVTKDGATPSSCQVPSANAQPTADVSDVVGRASADLLARLGGVPQESMPEVARVHTQLAVLGASPAVGEVPGGKASADAGVKVLKWEDSVIYGLKVALAYAGSATPDIEAAIDRHSARAAALRAAIPGALAAEASYNLSAYPAVSDAASAKAFMQAVESDSVVRWNISATETPDAAWRRYALTVSAEDARAAAKLIRAEGGNPLEAEFAK